MFAWSLSLSDFLNEGERKRSNCRPSPAMSNASIVIGAGHLRPRGTMSNGVGCSTKSVRVLLAVRAWGSSHSVARPVVAGVQLAMPIVPLGRGVWGRFPAAARLAGI
jgi:hypothetical protein